MSSGLEGVNASECDDAGSIECVPRWRLRCNDTGGLGRPGPRGPAHPQWCSAAPGRLRNRFSQWLGPVGWFAVSVCAVSVSRALRPSKLAAMQPMQPCLGQACQVCPAKVCIATFGGFLTFAQPRNIEPSGWGN